MANCSLVATDIQQIKNCHPATEPPRSLSPLATLIETNSFIRLREPKTSIKRSSYATSCIQKKSLSNLFHCKILQYVIKKSSGSSVRKKERFGVVLRASLITCSNQAMKCVSKVSLCFSMILCILRKRPSSLKSDSLVLAKRTGHFAVAASCFGDSTYKTRVKKLPRNSSIRPALFPDLVKELCIPQRASWPIRRS